MMTFRLHYVFYPLIIGILFSSCSIYKQQFDCPPPSGIPCASVTDIEKMIVETEKGFDLLLIPESEKDECCFWCGQKKANPCSSLKASAGKRKLWMCSQKKGESLIRGHYLEQSDSTHCQGCEIEPEDFFFCEGKVG